MEQSKTGHMLDRRHIPLFVVAGVLLVSAVVAAMTTGWASVVLPTALLAASFAPFIIENWAHVRLPEHLNFSYALLLLGGPYLGSYLHFYGVWTVWDTVVHFYSGFVIALGAVFALALTANRYRLKLPPWFEAVVIVAVSGFVALLWEMAEFFSDALIGTTAQRSNFDTMVDLIAGTASGLLVALAFVGFRLHGRFPVFDRFQEVGSA